jgi:hypothetical protein
VRTAVIFDLEKSPGQHHPEDPDGDVLACHWLTWRRLPSANRPCEAPGVAVHPGLSGRHRLPLSALPSLPRRDRINSCGSHVI